MNVRNAWIAATLPGEPAPALPEPAVPALPTVTGAAGPQQGMTGPDSADRLPRKTMGRTAAVWIIGTHGGAGETALSQLIVESQAASHSWPVSSIHDGNKPRVLLVCRSHMTGLRTAQKALTEWASGTSPPVELLGLAILADAPGRLPKPLRDFAAIVSGGAPRTWHLPWIEAWRLGEPPTTIPKELRTFITDINTLLPQPAGSPPGLEKSQ
ncbi:DUF6668 family protein [Crystallibacter degradans]|uniref:DUF6668 family protein n=1 Tax=Crystallibacter degradans TaxID=2726743 RepID=UPI00197B62AE|nr:DUF6668 family protein [Arthrobacter sp. SF27]